MWVGGHPWLQRAPEFGAPQVFNDAKHGADLFSLKAFGNIYSRIMVRLYFACCWPTQLPRRTLTRVLWRAEPDERRV